MTAQAAADRRSLNSEILHLLKVALPGRKPDRRCSLLVLRQTGTVRVEVTDSCPRPPVTPAGLSEGAESGRGLLLLDGTVDKWGVSPAPGGGKTVWFEC
ncbi:ATP-binding protein [Streptomyces sp. NPDC005209]|uniref:ATP-binding protein n=1 Tax=Streptomyces sp. NPDC005209 TaxID=3156715 RepID=UPI0033AAD9EA